MSAQPMPANPEEAIRCASLGPELVRPSVGASLYSLSRELTEYLDTLDLTEEGSPERDACERDIAACLGALSGKVDGVAYYLRDLEHKAAFAGAEADRLLERKASYERAHDALEKYAIKVLEALPQPKKGQKSLDGDHVTLTLRPSERVVILDEDQVPADYKVAAVQMPAADLPRMLEECPWLEPKSQSVTISKTLVKAAIKAGKTVSGADLEFPNNLRIR